MKFVLASHNKGKLAEMQRILGQLGVEVVLQSDLGLALEPEENGTTFAENAMSKPKPSGRPPACPRSQDDSGCCGRQHSAARRGSTPRATAGSTTTKARYQLLLQNLRGAMTRAAHFHTSVVCCFPDGDVLTAEASVRAPSPMLRRARAASAMTRCSSCRSCERRLPSSHPRRKTRSPTAETPCAPSRRN